MRLDKQQRKIIKELCNKYNLSQQEVFDIVKAPFAFIRETTANIKIDPKWSEEEFNNKKFNFNIPSIGKLYASYDNFKRINNVKKKKRS